MIVIIGLLALIAAVVVTVAAAATNTGSTHTVGDTFVIFGQHASGLSTGQLFMCGVAVGVLGMLGLTLLLGAFTRRLPSRASRRELKDARTESSELRVERDRLAQELGDERSEHLRAGSVLPAEVAVATSDSGHDREAGRAPADTDVITLDKPRHAVPDAVDRSGAR